VNLDIDANGSYDPLTDASCHALHVRAVGRRADRRAMGSAAQRIAADIAGYLASIESLLDVDGDGSIDALTDGLLIFRFMSGLRGAALTHNAIGTGASRSAMQIEDFLHAAMP
jgi:hypothetical protein